MKRRARTPKNLQAGVGLIEVLVAVLVLSVGFLGVAALEARSMSTNNSAMARSMATIASYSILDAMRADFDAATKNGAYNTTVSTDACPAAGTGMASIQLSTWCNQLKDIAKATTITGEIECAGSGQCTITISYDDSRAGWGDEATQKVITKGML